MKRDDLYQGTVEHRKHVRLVGNILINMLKENLVNHDNNKLDKENKTIDEGFLDLMNGRPSDWWTKHQKEAHHTPKNVLDLLELIIDCTCACAARDGIENYKQKTLPKEQLDQIIATTEELCIEIIKDNDII